MSLHELL